MVPFKGIVAHACNLIAINKCVSSLMIVYQTCVFFLHFWHLKIKTDIAKESSAIEYKYIDRFICKRVFAVNQAWTFYVATYIHSSSVHLKSRVESKFEHKTGKV